MPLQWVQILLQVAPAILQLIPQLVTLGETITSLIKNAESTGQSGPNKRAAVVAGGMAKAEELNANQIEPSIDLTQIGPAIGHATDAIIAAINGVQAAQTVSTSLPAA